MACENGGCKEPIFLNQHSTIGLPECQDDCPTEINCNGEITYTDCITETSALSCIGTSENATQKEINAAINIKLCENLESTCTVSVDANDTCCGYLGDKLIAGTGIVITKNIPTDTEGCKTLTISESCFNYNAILPNSVSGIGTFRNKWKNLDPTGTIFGIAEYSNTKSCQVKLRGVVTINAFQNTYSLITVLPSFPTSVRRFSVNVLHITNIYPSFIDIYPDGSVLLYPNNNLIGKPISVSLDGIIFDTN